MLINGFISVPFSIIISPLLISALRTQPGEAVKSTVSVPVSGAELIKML
jgi:hypothetical protein